MSADWDAASYDRLSDPQVRWATVVVERIELHGVDTVLDAGCGSGRVTELVLQRFPDAHVVAVDSSEAMVAGARRRLEPYAERVDILHADLLEPMPLDRPVDAIFSNAVFHWIDDHDRLFANLAQAMRPGGQLVAQWGGGGNIARLLDAIVAVAGNVSPKPANFATADETEERLTRAGFTDARVWLHPDPADFESRAVFEAYLRTVCLRCHIDLLEPDERDAFVANVADRLPDRRIDYVRLNAVARRIA